MTATLSAQLATAFVENSPLPLLVLDRRGCVLGYNPAFERLVAPAAAADLQGRAYADLQAHPARALLGGDSTVQWEGSAGEYCHLRVLTVCLDQGEAVQARVYVDISSQIALEHAHEKLNEELRQNILTDRLTGLLNQRGIMLALEPQVARSRRYNNPMAVIMMEISGGADYDGLLVDTARLLKDQLRWADLIGCSDRHEFILVLPETTPEAAVGLADKLTRRIGEMTGQAHGAQPIETCYGITGWRRSDNANTLLARAATALSEARSAHSSHAVAL